MKLKMNWSSIIHWQLLFVSAHFLVVASLKCPIDFSSNEDIFNIANYKSVMTDLCDIFNYNPCYKQACEVLRGLENGEYWALKMLDASGKPPTTGLLVSDFSSMGHFTECVEIGYSKANTSNNLHMKGKYVRLALNINLSSSKDKNSSRPQYFHDYPDFGFPFEMYDCTLAEQDILKGLSTIGLQGGIQLGLCVPESCNGRDIADILTKNGTTLVATKVVEYVKDSVKWKDDKKNEEFSFENDVLSPIDIVAIIVLGIFVVTAIVGTSIDVIAHQKEEVVLPSDLGSRVLLCFSLYTNGRKLLSTSSSKGSINCLNGLKCLSMTWVVVGHAWYIPGTLFPWANSMDIAEIFAKWEYQTIFNAALAVDTFFLIGGFLFCFHFLNQLDKTSGKLNPVMVGMMYVHRYIRLTPVFAVSMLLLSTLLAHMGWGPLWDGMVNQRNHCGEAWWSNLLYINNFVNMDNICLGETWYLACDFQFYLLGPLLVYPIWRFRLGGVTWIFFCLFLSCFIPGMVTYLNDWPPSQSVTVIAPGDEWMHNFYIKSYNRASPWVVGLILGLIINKIRLHQTKININKFVSVAMWSLSIVLCLAPLYGLESYWPFDLSCLTTPSGGHPCWNVWQAVSYTALGRLSWSLGIAWVIFACVTGNAGLVNSILSWKLFTPLARLTYCCYLLHMHLLYYFYFSRKDIMYYDGYLIFYYFLTTLVVSNFFALVFSLLFEAPFIGLEKIMFGRGGGNSGHARNKTKKQPENNKTSVEAVKNQIEEETVSKNQITNGKVDIGMENEEGFKEEETNVDNSPPNYKSIENNGVDKLASVRL